jgi:hypothetical protein
MEEAFLNSSSLWATVYFGDSNMLNLMKIAILLIVGSVPSGAKIHFFI